ncbi:unnamed protein product [Pneumocystis jirovecii]|uniref:U3 small nucleolar ribonucleoprotein protein MPP10 n=1 Tax=Pneumocystis jirovecii TaxID=42068 RepID=L0PAM3_PNEJI|nr:unnamed protein product [Pneumocystis jirovecii]
MRYETSRQLNSLLCNPKLFLKPSNELHSIILCQVKKLLDPIVKQNSIFEELYIDNLDNNQIFEEVKLITDELLDNQINFQEKKKHNETERDTIKRNIDNSLKITERDSKKNKTCLNMYVNNTLLINDDFTLKEDKEVNRTKDSKQNNLVSIDDKLYEKEDSEETHSLFNLNDTEINEEYATQEIENTNEIRYTDFFSPTEELNYKELSIENITENGSEDADKSEESTYMEEVEKNNAFKVPEDLFKLTNDEINEKKVTIDKSEYTKNQEILSKKIKELEIENITKKDWKLMGEVKAKDRSINSLLEEDIEFERATRSIPITTKENILNLEEIIKKRIMDSNFDEIQKVYPKEKKIFNTSKLLEIYDRKNEKSLTEIYEDEYKKKTDPTYLEKEDQKLNKEHNEIKELFQKAIKKLNSLSNLYYKPKYAKPSLNIVSNVSTIVMEEAQPSSFTASTMLAPHEIYVTGSEKNNKEVFERSGVVIAKDEMTRQEKLRIRRRLESKKKRHRSLLNKTNRLTDKITKILKKGNIKIIQPNNEAKNISAQILKKNNKKIKNSAVLKL